MRDSPVLYALMAFFCASVLTLVLTPVVRKLANSIGAVDIPRDERRMHRNAVPLLGGIAIFAGVTLTSFFFCEVNLRLLLSSAGGLLVCLIGFTDDLFDLNPYLKLAGEFAAAAVVLPCFRIEHFELFGNYLSLGVLSVPVTLLWIVGLTNAFNLIDGLDGLACGVSVICSLSLTYVAARHADYPVVLMAVILCGACLGFLPFNIQPAKIFMGDTGALYLGYLLSLLSIAGTFKTTAAISFLIPILLFGYPLFDTLFSFFRRIVKGKNPFQADKGHLHHRMVALGLTVNQTVLLLYAVCSLLGILAIELSEHRTAAFLIILVLAVLAGILNYLYVRGKKEKVESNQPDRTDKEEPSDREDSDE
ncbi:MAG: undecaprenyl/decaprenyl-phosphate alpha-N-acetylglucosaminyl 1-phosphate transferase [Clostridia bacterium]|nr:undecaprenyl/decaprenyl-phosphate alpha-N-acetylglucosaminyl 1-phosphate transferase [Clostridia bacterium]